MAEIVRTGRFETKLTAEAAALNASIDFDKRLYPYDIAGSQAHARMLAHRGLLSAQDADLIVQGLEQVRSEIEHGKLTFDPALEDVHMNVEHRLVELIGEPGRRLHTARSRNDQVATDLRLYARAAATEQLEALDQLRAALVAQARAHLDVLMPGYTHLQRAQPVRLSHHLLAYCEMLARDRGRIVDALRRSSECPLGSAALASTGFPIDREEAAHLLGFGGGPTHNSLDAVSDRDFAVELVAAAALCMTHLSRLGEELVLWSSAEFAFVRLPEGFCSGSSIMPQKVNPDIAELVRAKVGRVVGALTTLLVVLKGLPLAYNKDLQETQEPLYDAMGTLASSLRVMAGVVAGLRFDTDRLTKAATTGHLLATELADALAEVGVPFRTAHSAAGALVRLAVERGCELGELTDEALRAHAGAVEPAVLRTRLDAYGAVERRDHTGGPARRRVLAAIERVELDLATHRAKRHDAAHQDPR
jgi:argininosuccinate lyase